MNFFKSSIIAVTLSSFMLLKVEGMLPVKMPFNIPSESYQANDVFRILEEQQQTPSDVQDWVTRLLEKMPAPVEMPFKIAADRVPNKNWLFGIVDQTPGKRPGVAHPQAEGLRLDVAHNNAGVVYLMNNSGATLKYKVLHLGSGLWTEYIESRAGMVHTVKSKDAQIWFHKY